MSQAVNHQESRRIAFIQASWHADIVGQARNAFLAEIDRLGHSSTDVDVFDVAGAFELPLHAKLLGASGRYAAVVATALVVDGGIYRHDFVAGAVVSALMQVQLETGVPLMSVVLTPHHFTGPEQHAFFHEHFLVKGTEAARACVETMEKVRALQRKVPSRGILSTVPIG